MMMNFIFSVTAVRSTACVYFHRFFMSQSMKEHNRYIIGASCIFLACKVEEFRCHIEHLVNHYFFILNVNQPVDKRRVPETDPVSCFSILSS